MRYLCINIYMIDDFDRKLLKQLQRNAVATNAQLGEAVNISTSQAGRRKARLESMGLVEGYHARLNPAAANLHIQAFIQLSLNTHSKEAATALHQFLATEETITNIWTMTGRADYLLQIYCHDLAELHHLVHDVLLGHASISHVESQIVMNHTKSDGILPLRL